MVIDIFNAVMLFNQAHSRFLAYSLDSGNIVGRISHQRFDVDKFLWRNVIPLFNRLVVIYGRVIVTRLCDGQNYARFVACKLQIVLIARGDKTTYSLFVAKARDGTDYIVRLVTLFFKDCYSHSAQNFLCKRHLRCQSLGHGLALRLIALVLLMAKRRRVHIKRGADIVGLLLVYEL